LKILVTGAASRLAKAVAVELGKDHELRLMDTVLVDVGAQAQFMQGSILNPDDAWRAVRGVDAVIHTCEPPPDLPMDTLKREQMMIDYATRGTHNLFKASVEAGVKKLLYAGTLTIFNAYPDDVYITELWKPFPSPEIGEIAKYLGELTCREFARDYMVTVTCLRLGRLVLEEEVKGQKPDLMWLDLRDAAQAFRCALSRDSSNNVWWTNRWRLYHICADIPNPKFLIDGAAQMEYKPTHNFQANYQGGLAEGTR